MKTVNTRLTMYNVIFCKEGLNSGTAAGENISGEGKGELGKSLRLTLPSHFKWKAY